MAKGNLVVHGGGTTGKDATGAFLKCVGSMSAPIVVLGQVSEDPLAKGKSSADWLRENGATNVYAAQITERDASTLPELCAKLAAARGYWIPGGDQNRFFRYFKGTDVPKLLRGVLERGGAGGGSSAGASLCGDIMPTGSSGIKPTEDEDRANLKRNMVGTAPGLGVLPGFCVDTHFLYRERTQRSVNIALTNPQIAVVGVDQDGWFHADLARGTLSVGKGQVVTIRAAAPVRTGADTMLGCADVRMRVLLPGDTVRLSDIIKR